LRRKTGDAGDFVPHITLRLAAGILGGDPQSMIGLNKAMVDIKKAIANAFQRLNSFFEKQ
jgi:hypothetical protein